MNTTAHQSDQARMPYVIPITVLNSPYFREIAQGLRTVDCYSSLDNYYHRLRYVYLLVMVQKMTVSDVVAMRDGRDWDHYDTLDDLQQVEVQFNEMYTYLRDTYGEASAKMPLHMVKGFWHEMRRRKAFN